MSHANPTFFVSYANEDSKYFEHFFNLLKSHTTKKNWILWSDGSIAMGENWRTSIDQAIQDCDFAILCISSNFFASRFISESELPKIIAKAKNNQFKIIPVLLKPYDFQSSELKDLQTYKPSAKDFGLNTNPNRRIAYSQLLNEDLVAPYGNDDIFVNNFVQTFEKMIHPESYVTNSESVIQGKIIHNIPPEMEIYKTVLCKVKIAYNEKILLKEIKSKEYSAAEPLEVDHKMSVEVSEIDDGDFKIVARSEKNQVVTEYAATTWLFSITPLKPGTHQLLLVAYVDTDDRKRVTSDYQRLIKVVSELKAPVEEHFYETQIIATVSNKRKSPVSSLPLPKKVDQNKHSRLLKYSSALMLVFGVAWATFYLQNKKGIAPTQSPTTVVLIPDTKMPMPPDSSIFNPEKHKNNLILQDEENKLAHTTPKKTKPENPSIQPKEDYPENQPKPLDVAIVNKDSSAHHHDIAFENSPTNDESIKTKSTTKRPPKDSSKVIAHVIPPKVINKPTAVILPDANNKSKKIIPNDSLKKNTDKVPIKSQKKEPVIIPKVIPKVKNNR